MLKIDGIFKYFRKMGNTIILQKMPSAIEVLAKAGTTLFRKGKKDLPDNSVSVKNCSIDKKNLAAYNKICQFKDKAYVPATYPYIFSFPIQMQLMSDKGFPYPLPGLVHLANSINQQEPLQISDNFDVFCHFGDKIHHDKGQAFEIKTGIIVNNRVTWTCTSIYLYRGKEGIGNEVSWEEPLPIDKGRKQSWNLPYTLGMQYAMVNKDINPIHIVPITAKIFGMPRHIIHGMWNLGRALAVESEKENLDKVSINVHFKTPVFLPAVIIYRSKVDNTNSSQINFDIVDKNEEKTSR